MAAVPCCAVRACLLTERQLHGEQMRTASVAIWPIPLKNWMVQTPCLRWGTGALKALEFGVSGRKSGPSGTFEDSPAREVLRECSIPDLL